MRQRQPAQITTGVGLLHQFQIADDMLIVKRVTMKFFKQIKSNVWFMFQQRVADDIQLVIQTNRIDFMAHALQGRDNIVLSLDFQRFFAAEAVERIRRD